MATELKAARPATTAEFLIAASTASAFRDIGVQHGVGGTVGTASRDGRRGYRCGQMMPADIADALGWGDDAARSWSDLGRPGSPGRVSRLDRGWSTVLVPDASVADDDLRRRVRVERVRNLGLDVAVGDWVVPSADGERVEHVLDRHSAFVRRASFEGARAVSHTIAANIDTVFLCHSYGAPPNQRRLERELVLAFDSGADPVVVLTKADLVDDPEPGRRELKEVALGVPVLVTSGRSSAGVDRLAAYAGPGRTVAFLGASGVGKSTLVNVMVGAEVQATTEVRGDHRGRHTTVASELIAVPAGGWLIDTPGVRALSLWLSGQGIERAFVDVFELMDRCRFRDCKHDREPGCAVQEAIADGRLDADRFANLERLIAEEAELEAEQEARERAADRRRPPRPKRNLHPGTRHAPDDDPD